MTMVAYMTVRVVAVICTVVLAGMALLHPTTFTVAVALLNMAYTTWVFGRIGAKA